MNPQLIAALLAVLLPQLVCAAVDFTPRFMDIFTEGATLRRLYFSDGEKKFMLSLNRETEVVPDAGGALFKFAKVPDATFLVVRSRHSPDDRFEGQTLERYRESAKRLLPVGTRGAVITGETPDVFPINSWKSYRITLSFNVGPVIYQQSVTFLNMNDADQVALITSAPEKDFGEAAHRSFQIFRTWQEMLPGDEEPIQRN